MPKPRPFDDAAQTSIGAASVGIELEGFGGGATVPPVSGPSGPPGQDRRRRIVPLGAGAMLVALATIVVTLVAADPSTRSTNPPVAPADDAGSIAAPRATTARPEVTVADLVDQLPTTPDGLLSGRIYAWVDMSGHLRARNLSTGEDLPIRVLAERNLPPLPDHVHLMGAPNATWLLDLAEPERSGKLSNVVHMVRLGTAIDSYGFISRGEDETSFFVGSLWGPSMNGTATASNSSTILDVPRSGIVVSSPAAESAILDGSGLEPLPSRLGRIVAAGPTRLAGIFCDELARCVGRIADWDGGNEIEIPVDQLVGDHLRVSPDGGLLVTASRSQWTLTNLFDGTATTWETRLTVDDSLTWSTDNRTIFWTVGDSLVASEVGAGRPTTTRVRQQDSLDPRLPGSDVRVLDIEP